MSERLRAAAGATGVVVLTASWIGAGLATEGFDPVRQSISQLQRQGTGTGGLMTGAFALFGIGALAVAPILGRLGRLPRTAVTLVGLATLGAAVSPLGAEKGGLRDGMHLAFGATGYASLSLLPLLAAPALAGRARVASVVLGGVTSACLLGTVPAESFSGALQRVGFLSGHLWLLGACLAVLRDRQWKLCSGPGKRPSRTSST